MKNFTKTIFAIFFLLSSLIFLSSSFVNAAIPRLINYQGKLTDTNGVPLTGSYAITFRIYDSDTAGNLLWEETQQVVIDKGIFGVLLGSITNLNLTFDAPYFLEVKVGSEVMSPRQRIASVGYAIRAEKADVAEEAKTKGSSTDATPGYLNAKVKNSITVDNNQLQLVGDSASPGTSKFYATDASGNKGWQFAPPAIPSNIQVYSTPGTYTWTKPANVNKVYVKVWGGGGSGGGLGHSSYVGVAGGISSFAGGVTIQATGGTGGGGGTNQFGYVGGDGGVGSNGTINLTGGEGGATSNTYPSSGVGGAGGGGAMGGAGAIGSLIGNGKNGTPPGGGGSGVYGGAAGGGGGGYSEGLVTVTSDVTVTVGSGGVCSGGGGGNGANGLVIVYY